MTQIPEGAQVSDDGNYWWDGSQWQLVDQAAGEVAETSGTEDAGVTAEELEPVGDTGEEPGDESVLDDRLRAYFEPDVDGVPDDDALAEASESLDDSQFQGATQGG